MSPRRKLFEPIFPEGENPPLAECFLPNEFISKPPSKFVITINESRGLILPYLNPDREMIIESYKRFSRRIKKYKSYKKLVDILEFFSYYSYTLSKSDFIDWVGSQRLSSKNPSEEDKILFNYHLNRLLTGYYLGAGILVRSEDDLVSMNRRKSITDYLIREWVGLCVMMKGSQGNNLNVSYE